MASSALLRTHNHAMKYLLLIKSVIINKQEGYRK